MKSKNCGILCITSYVVTRHYGGPEEGGWWYNLYFPKQTVYVPAHWSETKVEQARQKMHARNRKRYAYGNIYSVKDGVAVETYSECFYQEFKQTQRPHYE